MKTLLLGAMLLCGGALMVTPRPVQAQLTVAASSDLAGVPMPPKTMRLSAEQIPHEITDALQTMIQEGGSAVKRGRTEVLGWGGDYKKARANEYKARLAAALTKGGWQYEEGQKLEGAQGATMVSALKTSPTRKALVGFWFPTDDALILAWTEMLPATSGANDNIGVVPPSIPNAAEPAPENAESTPAASPAPASGTVFNISDEQFVLNVAKGFPAPKVAFPALAPKPGRVRGYVKGSDGKPLKGAVIGVRSTAVGGAETSASGKTDANGYYEIMVPFGAAGFYASGYTKEYGDGVLALGLTPADGEADEFATPKGHVENWILQPYGIADRAGVQDNPKYLNNYYGGSVTLEFLDEYSGIAGPKGLPFGSTVEVTLTPKGPLMDGSAGRSFTVRKEIKEQMEHRLFINNIPIGTYQLSARMLRGGNSVPLNLRETGPDRASGFGIEPKQAQGNAELMFRPYSARAESVMAGHGNWKEVDVNIMQ